MWEAQVVRLELKANKTLDKTRRPACPWRERSLAERTPGEAVACPATLEAAAQESPLAETMKVNRTERSLPTLCFLSWTPFHHRHRVPEDYFVFPLKASTSSTACTQTGKQTTVSCRCRLLTLRIIRFPPVCFPSQHSVMLPIKG